MKSPRTTLYVAHLIGDALLLWLGYAWLSIPESDAAHLLWSVFVVLLFVCSALWLHGATFVFFRNAQEPSLRKAATTALHHLPAFFVLALLSAFLYFLASLLNGTLDRPSFTLASWLTLTIRKPVPPSGILAVFHSLVLAVEWLLLPAILVPVAAEVSVRGFSGFRRFAGQPRVWRSLKIFFLLLGALCLPVILLVRVPKMPNFSTEMASFFLRGGVAYLLFAGLLLVLERTTSSGMPSLTQRNSSATP